MADRTDTPNATRSPTVAHARAGELGTILGVWAHPDDEAYLSAGLMALAVEQGARVVCVTATKGEHGTADPEGCPPELLAAVRTKEMDASLRVLGVTEHHWLGHADGECAAVAHDVGVDQVAAIIEEIGPRTVVTFGPDGMTGHPDHIAVGAWTTDAARQVDPSIQILHAIMDRELMSGLPELTGEGGVYGPGCPPLADRDELPVVLDLPPAILDRKVAALESQESQTSSLIDTLGADRYRDWLSIESFAEGWPP